MKLVFYNELLQRALSQDELGQREAVAWAGRLLLRARLPRKPPIAALPGTGAPLSPMRTSWGRAVIAPQPGALSRHSVRFGGGPRVYV